MKLIKKKLPQINVQVYGYYVGKFDYIKKYKRVHSIEKEIFTNTSLPPDKVNELYSRSKICLNINKQQTVYGGNMRLYEILATNSFQITNFNDYIEDEFCGCVESYKNTEELLQKIVYYLDHENERKAIAQRGYDKVMKSELFYHRAKKILDDVVSVQKT